ncbi:MAG: hypothetical protein GY926_02530 [bacterium]|nr:hypothetical protein [bacterium]
MRVADSLETLRLFLSQRSLDLDRAAPQTLLLAVIAWYETERTTDAAPLQNDGDMLLFQYGTYDWSEGPTFHYGITRQFVTTPGDELCIWQLSITAHYDATTEAVRLGSDHQWVGTPAECEQLRNHLSDSPATAYVQPLGPLRVELSFEQV